MLSCTDVDCGAVQMQREVSAIECNARLETNVDPLADQQCPPNQLMVENRSYDIVSAHNRPACKNSASVSANFPADQSNRPLDDVTNICGSDLLRFAKQIANGMVSWYCAHTCAPPALITVTIADVFGEQQNRAPRLGRTQRARLHRQNGEDLRFRVRTCHFSGTDG